MSNNRLKPFLYLGMGLLIASVAVGAASNLVARKQAAEMDAIAQKALEKYTSNTANDTANTLNVLIKELGLRSIGYTESDPSIPVEPNQAKFSESISPDLSHYLKAQSQKTQGPLDPIPQNLQTYLTEHQDTLTTLQSHLRTSEPPIWHFKAESLSDISTPLPNLLGLGKLQQLLSLKAINDYQQQQPAEMTAALEASAVIQEAISQRPELISYLISLITMNGNVGIMRHLEGVPLNLSAQLLTTNQQQRAQEYLQVETWSQYISFQNRTLASLGFIEEPGGFAMLKKMPMEHTYVTFSNVDIARRMDTAYGQLSEFTLCSASVKDISAKIVAPAPWWNALSNMRSGAMVRQWQKGGQAMLAAELTHHVTTAKALAAEQGQWPETLPDLDSRTCPGEQWVYEVSPDGEMSLSFSHELAWLTAEETVLPISYQAAPID